MTSAYFQEQKRYLPNEIQSALKCTDLEFLMLARKLKEYGVLKAVKSTDSQREMTDLLDVDIEVSEVEAGTHDLFYIFTFVGVLVVFGRVIKCYPKYLDNITEPKNELCQVIKVLDKYNSKHQIIRMINDVSEEKAFNLLALIIFLIRDYYENGSYNNTETVIESNGSGEILWENTINDSFVIFANNRPYYTDLKTRKRKTNDLDFFKRLHESVLTIVSKELESADLLDLFEFTKIDLSDEKLDDFGEKEYILYRLENEISTQFNTRKQLVLKALYAFVSHNGKLEDIDCLSLYGTNSFNLVWESICSEILDNQLHVRLQDLSLPVELKSPYAEESNKELIELIDRPYWSFADGLAKDTLIPDLITIRVKNGKAFFMIFDAKYYNPVLEKNLQPKSQPGIESIVKQYFYQMAYHDFIEKHSFAGVVNCFLIPTKGKEVIPKGHVRLEFLERNGLKNIQIRLLPAKLAYDKYISGTKLDIDYLELDEIKRFVGFAMDTELNLKMDGNK